MTDPAGDGGSAPVDPRDLEAVQALFDAALDRPLEARRAFLDAAEVDSRIREEVWSLLEAHAAEGPLDHVAAAIARVTNHLGDDKGLDFDSGPPAHIGPYAVDATIGEGGMATVYRGRRADQADAPWVAVKVLRPEADSVRVRRRFMAERQILASLEHPNIARYLDDGLTSEGVPYLVTELHEGDRLDRHCERVGLDLAGRLALFLQVCRAVQYAHGQGVVHRDLKPDNVLVTDGGDLRLLDFGIAKILDRTAFPGLGGPTTTGVHVLTLGYASPEQLHGTPITPASDVYQLGLLLVKMVSGRVPPVHTRSIEPLELDLASEGRTPPAGIDAKVDAQKLARLRPMALHALRVQPEHRPTSVGEWIGEIEAVLAMPNEAPAKAAREPEAGHTDRRSVATRPLALLVLALLAAVATAATLLLE